MVHPHFRRCKTKGILLHTVLLSITEKSSFCFSLSRSMLDNFVTPAELYTFPLRVGAAASVLLGFAPPSTLSASCSSKLNEVLVPNPFDRPHSVFMIEVTGVEDSELMVG
ncbi:Uncharacterized protein Adt_27392 [Abeliophyllum distichum]|uniref:DUF7794 domain-containing protein n=1 Tax=Abeliophyllum distichum TaxID=126358 RepID=A0ABD1RTL7_9LAMI